eukprot:GHVP01044843.1.p1 GENE.GHVP01044843.1~~GHVP01044843.1.p1  ORF type:complete len:520 (+),score=47.05 GHVP01044843.1:1578-3137(+)
MPKLESTVDKPKPKSKESKPKPKSTGSKPRLDSTETSLPSKNATTKKWIPVAEMWKTGKTKYTTFATWNVNSGSESHRKLASVWAQANMVDILILPEGGSRTVQTQTHRGGVSALIRRNLGLVSTTCHSDSSGKWSILEILPRLKPLRRVFGIYCSPSATPAQFRECLQYLQVRLDTHQGQIPIIMGDLNTDHHTAAREKSLKEFLAINELSIWNDEPTHKGGHRLDVIITKDLSLCKTHDAGTDHLPVSFKIQTKPPSIKTKLKKKADPSEFNEKWITNVMERIASGGTLQRSIEEGTRLPMEKQNQTHPEIENLLKSASEHPSAMDPQIRLPLAKELKKVKKSRWQKTVISSIKSNNPFAVTSITKATKARKKETCDQGELLAHMKSLFELPEHKEARTIREKPNMNLVITQNELDDIIKNLPRKKSTGPNGIPLHAWVMLYSSDTGKLEILRWVNEILQGTIPPPNREAWLVPIPKKGNDHRAENQRIIAIQNSEARIFERVIKFLLCKTCYISGF